MISHKYKFIFRHIGKTGGTSLEVALGEYAAESTKRETIRTLKGKASPIKNKHASLKDLMDQQRGEKRYFRFTFVRNPWVRAVSRYFYSIRRWEGAVLNSRGAPPDQIAKYKKRYGRWKKNIRPSFKKFIKMTLSPGTSVNDITLKYDGRKFRILQSRHVTGFLSYYDDEGKFIKQKPWLRNFEKEEKRQRAAWVEKNTLPETGHLYDYVGKSHRMQEDMDIICKKIGMPEVEIPHVNKSSHKHYTEYYDDETRKLVADYYKEDIDMFNFKFGK